MHEYVIKILKFSFSSNILKKLINISYIILLIKPNYSLIVILDYISFLCLVSDFYAE